jgi:hypothetical protein
LSQTSHALDIDEMGKGNAGEFESRVQTCNGGRNDEVRNTDLNLYGTEPTRLRTPTGKDNHSDGV